MFSHISAGPRFGFSIVVKDNLPSTRGLIALLAALICNEIQKLEALEKMEVEGVNRATDLLKAMSHPCRLIILHRLAQGSCKADELEKLLFLEQAIVAQHLARLRFGRIIVGKKIYIFIKHRFVED